MRSVLGVLGVPAAITILAALAAMLIMVAGWRIWLWDAEKRADARWEAAKAEHADLRRLYAVTRSADERTSGSAKRAIDALEVRWAWDPYGLDWVREETARLEASMRG